MQIKTGDTYIFTKSGNEVRAVAPAGAYRGRPMWEVVRTQGASTGKRMDVPSSSLVKQLD